ncbi:MAG TPA: DnaJ domain-containing protein [Vicinamibacteria bacterium]|nr:DnaJ domain-containing protein [Vicinamibacteria bacterium]
MAKRDCYLVLGVPRDALPAAIRRAYLRLAKALHPDHAGEDGTRSFQELREAYATLSDPRSRRAYDRSLDDGRRGEAAVSSSPDAVAEPLSILHADARYRPSREEIRERFSRNFAGVGVPKGEAVAGLNVEVVLSRDEAARGLVVPIDAPVFQTCPFCGGSGRDWLFPCLYCGEEGTVERTERLHLRVPARVRAGSVYEIPLDRLGVRNFYLRVHVLVDDRLTS